jgi:hypothetical protein
MPTFTNMSTTTNGPYVATTSPPAGLPTTADIHELSSRDLKEEGNNGEDPPPTPLLLPPPNDPDFYAWVDMLEKLHRLNRLLESKEEQAIALDYEFALVSAAAAPDRTPPARYATPPPCFNLEVARFREINARLTAEIGHNSGRLGQLEAEGRDKRRLVSQLEFDVNLVEREHKRLEADLQTVQSLVLEGYKVCSCTQLHFNNAFLA